MFNPSQADVRRFFCAVHAKAQAGQPMEAIETLGGKLIGAGGGGFLMFYTEDSKRLRHAMTQAGLREVRFRFDFEGTRIVTQS